MVRLMVKKEGKTMELENTTTQIPNNEVTSLGLPEHFPKFPHSTIML